MLYVGIDYHKRYCQLAVVAEGGRVVKEERLPTEREALVRFFTELGEPCAATLEAGRNWGLVYDWLEEAGVVEELKLAHPLRVKAIAAAKIKTDKIDARILAQLLRANLLPTAHIPGREVRALKSLLRQRLFLVVLRTRVKNRIHALEEIGAWSCDPTSAQGAGGP